MEHCDRLEQILPQQVGVDNTNCTNVSFVGGPYDGCASTTQPGNHQLSIQIEMPVSPNVLRLLTGEAAGEEKPIRAVASYRLMFTAHGPRYRFACFRPVEQRHSEELALWHHALIAAWNTVLRRAEP